MNSTIAMHMFESESCPFTYFEKITEILPIEPPTMDGHRKCSLPDASVDWAWPAHPVEDAPLSGESNIFSGADSHDFFHTAIPTVVCLDCLPELHTDLAYGVSPGITPPVSEKLSPPGSHGSEPLFPQVSNADVNLVKVEDAPAMPAPVIVSEFHLQGLNAPVIGGQVAGKRKTPEIDALSVTSTEDSDRDSPTNTRPKKQRGMFARQSPKIQQNAREGQKHWGQKVQEVRAEWTQRCMWQKNPQFSAQIGMCTRLHIKSQHECILRQLQLAAVDGIVIPAAFSNDETRSFLGWTGFEVVQEHAAEFRSRIEGMFATPPNHKTLNNTMRRAGLVPEFCWGDAWVGKACFMYDANKRAQYGRE